ncbi:hypothetical protein GF351_05515 [Candidatus Woesearchaeota archaeon]|nr:hypothetical protein [Candidatus Woesearchaeota archaeon]
MRKAKTFFALVSSLLLIIVMMLMSGCKCCGPDTPSSGGGAGGAAGGSAAEETDYDYDYEEYVNSEPEIVEFDIDDMPEDSEGTTVDLSGYCTDEDTEDVLTWTVEDYDESIVSVTLADNAASIVPVQDAYGETSITFACTDDYDASDQITVDFEVTPVQEEPVIVSLPTTTAVVGQEYIYDVQGTDVDGDTLEYALTSGPPGMSIEPSTGVITWTPDTAGNYQVEVRVSDGIAIALQQYTVTVTES